MNIGDKAPEILGKDEQGRDIRLSDYKGRKLEEDRRHHPYHLRHQRGRCHRTDLRWQTGEDQGTCRADLVAIGSL